MKSTLSISYFFLFLYPFNLFSQVHTIGVMNPLTGKFAIHGESCLEGQKLAIRELDVDLAKKINFEFEDSLSTTQGGLLSFNKFILNKNLLSVLFLGSNVGLAINPLSLKEKVPIMGIAGHKDYIKNNPYAFNSFLDSKSEAIKISDYILKKNYERLAIITLDYDFTLYMREEIKNNLTTSNVKFVFDETIHSETDFNSLITRLRSKKPDILVINHTGETFPLLLKQLYQQKITFDKITINANASEIYFKSAGVKEASNGIVLFEVNFPDNFRKQISKEIPLPSYSYTCYTGASFVLKSIEFLSANGHIDRESLNIHLKNISKIYSDFSELEIKDKIIKYTLVPLKVQDYKLERLQE